MEDEAAYILASTAMRIDGKAARDSIHDRSVSTADV
jgi:hypothetical protein